ncbi:MAG: hypothetical protein RLZZ387_2577 [Chloroflexota bacterium]|jgi:hypothetical protein
MGFRKNYADRTITFECDGCGEMFEADGLDFHDALDEYKDRGGVARLEVGEWMHFCEDCK